MKRMFFISHFGLLECQTTWYSEEFPDGAITYHVSTQPAVRAAKHHRQNTYLTAMFGHYIGGYFSSTDVDVLKFQLVQYNQFYDGKNQQDSSECLLMLIEIINKGSVPYYGSHDSNSTGVSLSDILFSFMLEKYIVCNVCGLRSPSIESNGVLYTSPTHTSSMQELIMQGLQQKLEKSCFRCNKSTWHVESNHILQPPNYLIIVVNRFRYINNQFAKDKCSIPMDMTVVLGYHKFSLQATIDHHGPSIYSGHYTTSVNCCNRTFYCNDNKIMEFDMINTKNSSTAYVVIYKLIT